MTDKSDQRLPDEAVATEEVADARRDFLKKLGKYAAVTSVGTSTLLVSSTASAASCRPANGGNGNRLIAGGGMCGCIGNSPPCTVVVPGSSGFAVGFNGACTGNTCN